MRAADRSSRRLAPTLRPARSRRAVGVASLAVLAACGERYAWDQPSATVGPRVVAPQSSASAAIGDEVPGAEGPVGGVFESCVRGFVSTGEPVRDVTRLGIACGSSTGMERVGDVTREGAIAEGGAHVDFALTMVRGACYRVFASATADVGDLVVELRSSRGTVIASDHERGPVAIVQPDRPVCALGDDEAVIDVSAGAGRGRFALEIYAAR